MNTLCCRLLALLVLVTATVSRGRADADQFDSLRDFIRNKLAHHEAPSIAVAVVRNGKILWEEGFGWADKEQKRAATENTPYRLGSVSKPITATAIMVARERGLVDLDRPINEYLGENKLRGAIGDAAGATVRRVVQHMSGLPEYSEAYYRDEPGEFPSLDLAIRRYGVLTKRPGERFVYSNLGYAALGGVLKHVSGKSYDDFLNDEVFVPLGMKHSAAPGPHLSPEQAIGYQPDGEREIDYTRIDVPAASVFASAHDMARFGLFHLKAHLPDQKQIVSDKNIDEMKNVTVPMGDAQYGFGWHIRKDSKGRLQVLHGGASGGADAQFTLVPEEKICVVVLANVTRHWPGAVTESVTNAILSTLLGGKPDDFPTLLPDPPAKTRKLPGKLEGKWTGKVHTHQGDLDLTLWCEHSGDVLAQLGKQAKTSVGLAQLDGAAFTGKMDGDIGTDDARRRKHELEWNVTVRGHVINGTLYATTKTTRPLRLGYWVELRWGAPAAKELPQATPKEVGMSADKLGRVKSVIQSAVDKNQTAGVVVLVARQGKLVYLESFGKMDLEADKPMQPNAIFRIYSMTKPITVAAALVLYEEGKFKLDDPVSKYLPEFKGLRVYAGNGDQTVETKREMTVRDLMRHTSGLTYGMPSGSPVDKLYMANKIEDPGDSLADMVGKLGKLPLQYQPGTRFHYSVSTDVLGRVIEVVSGKTLDEFLSDRILRPLDMRDTGFIVPAEKLNRFTASYQSTGKGSLRVIDAPTASRYRAQRKYLSGGGGLVSTARDYVRFCQMLLNGGTLQGTRVLRPETVREMTTNQLPAESLPMNLNGFPQPGLGFGLGVSVRLDTKSSKPDPAAGEYGWSGAASTSFWVAPRKELMVILLQQIQPYNFGLQMALKPAIYAAIEE